MRKLIAVMLSIVMMAAMLGGCGSKSETGNDEGGTANLEGSCEEILAQVYADADLDADLREAMQYYQTTAIDESSKEYILGTADVTYTDSVYSAPMMSSIAYQCVLLRIGADEDVEKVKQLLLDNADPAKWICVGAESVVVENVGDVILYIMADQATTDAVKAAFLAQGKA